MVTIRLVGWLYEVLFPYFLPLLITAYPFGVILYKLRHHDTVSNRDRNHFQIALAVIGGYFFFHFLYYLLWLGRQIEALLLDKAGFKDLLSHHIWYITRPLFATINLGWHITTPLAPFIFDNELIDGNYLFQFQRRLLSAQFHIKTSEYNGKRRKNLHLKFMKWVNCS